MLRIPSPPASGQPHSPAGLHPLLVATFEAEAVPYFSPWLSPCNCFEIEIESQPQCGENKGPEDDRLMPELTARFDIEGVGWFQEDVRQTLPNAGVVRFSEPPTEQLHDPRCRVGLDSGRFLGNRSTRLGSDHVQNGLGRDLQFLFHGSLQHEYCAYLSGAIRRKGKLQNGGAVRPGRPVERDQTPGSVTRRDRLCAHFRVQYLDGSLSLA